MAAVPADVKIYSWHDWNLPGVTPNVWVRVQERTPAQAAAEAIPVLKQRPQSDRVIQLWGLGAGFLNRSVTQIVKQKSFDTARDKQWMTQFFTLLKQANVTPEYVVMDYEDGVSFWQTSNKNLRAVYDTPSTKSKLPVAMQQYTRNDFVFGRPKFAAAVNAWNDWAWDLSAAALRDAVAAPAKAVFGRDIPMSNFGDLNITSGAMLDPNGWAIDRQLATSVSGWSSPALYLGGEGNLYRGEADPDWANFVNNINTLRTAVAGGDKVAPWVSDSRFGGSPELWAQQMYHIRASGVKTILLWNPERDRGETAEQFAATIEFTRNVINTMLNMPTPQTASRPTLTKLSFTTTTVSTGDVTTPQGTRTADLITLTLPAAQRPGGSTGTMTLPWKPASIFSDDALTGALTTQSVAKAA
jgi:hypothetical protein